MGEQYDVAIVGGGVIGCAVAYQLSTEGKKVVVLESTGKVGAGASSAALGGIIVETDDYCLGALSGVAAHSRTLLPAWVDAISTRSGIDIPVLTTGDIQVAMNEREYARLEEKVAPEWRALGFDVRSLTRAQLRDKEPSLNQSALGGFLLPAELALEPPRLMVALSAVLAAEANVEVRLHSTVVDVRADEDRATVILNDGTNIECGHAVIAGGYRSRDLVPEISAITFPVKGQAFEIRRPGWNTYPLRHHCFALVDIDGCPVAAYVVPRSDGRIAVGVTYEENLDDTQCTAAGQELLRQGLRMLIPGAEDWPVTRRWAGVRPGIVDGIPLIGPLRPNSRMILATGHYGLGVTLAPGTAELVSALINGNGGALTDAHLQICSPGRF